MIRGKHLAKAIFATALLLPLVSTRELPAGFQHETLKMHVEIAGTDFGVFEPISHLDRYTRDDSESYHVITLKRDFVTDKSLYLWASQTALQQSTLSDIKLVMRDNAGEAVAQYTMKYCQPLSWSVEASTPSSGGFHETVDFAVQEIDTAD